MPILVCGDQPMTTRSIELSDDVWNVVAEALILHANEVPMSDYASVATAYNAITGDELDDALAEDGEDEEEDDGA